MFVYHSTSSILMRTCLFFTLTPGNTSSLQASAQCSVQKLLIIPADAVGIHRRRISHPIKQCNKIFIIVFPMHKGIRTDFTSLIYILKRLKGSMPAKVVVPTWNTPTGDQQLISEC